MRVVCPGCAIAYEPPAELVTPGRRMRCARCGETWAIRGTPLFEPQQAPVSPPAAPELQPDPEPQPDPDPEPDSAPPEVVITVIEPPAQPAPRSLSQAGGGIPALIDRLQSFSEPPDPPPQSSAAVAIGWLATCAVLAALVWAAYAYRGEVMAAWPPSTRVYAGLGLMK